MASVSPLFLLPGIGMVLVAICSVWLWQRGKPSLWWAVWWGVLAWVLSVTAKSLASWPSTKLIVRHRGDPMTWLYVGLLTGVFECAIPLLLIWKSRLSRADWDQAVAFGIGFGAIEAFLIGTGSVVVTGLLLVSPGLFPVAMRNALTHQFRSGGLISIPFPVIERTAALLIHVLSSVLLICAVRIRQQRWFWLAFACKTAVDGFAGWSVLSWRVAESVRKMATVECVFVVFALIAMAALPSFKARFARLDQPQGVPSMLT